MLVLVMVNVIAVLMIVAFVFVFAIRRSAFGILLLLLRLTTRLASGELTQQNGVKRLFLDRFFEWTYDGLDALHHNVPFQL